jgi:predicted N-acetyltransferase YhbS
MRQSFHHADFQALTDLWNEFYPEKYHIDVDLLKLNTVESPIFDWGVSQVNLRDGKPEGFVAFKRSAAGLFKGPSIDQAHLTAIAYREPKVAVDMMADAKRVLRNRGINKVVFGADSRHFWPGCPADCGAICGFLMVEGFEESGEAHDLECDLSTYEPARPIPSDFEFRRIGNEEDLVALRVFMEQEFPGRWNHDVFDKISIEGPENCVFAAFKSNDVLGFALLQDWSHARPIGGGVWRVSLGENWGSLGPIGVAKSERGKGLGHGLLSAALSDLKLKGVKNCIIDWTTLDGFYGAHGFKVSRIYRPSSLRLSD